MTPYGAVGAVIGAAEAVVAGSSVYEVVACGAGAAEATIRGRADTRKVEKCMAVKVGEEISTEERLRDKR